MIVRKNLKLKIIIKLQWKILLISFLLGLIPTLLYYLGIQMEYTLGVPVSILGTTLAFFIGFRNNNAYGRWWEARMIWGELVNNSRSYAAEVLNLLSTNDSSFKDEDELKLIQRDLIYNEIGFVYALKTHLRKQPIEKEAKRFFSEKDWEEIAWQQNIPNAILLQISRKLRHCFDMGYTDVHQYIQFDRKINVFFDILGKCERIKNTIFPRQYDYFAKMTFYVFLTMLPFSLVEHTKWLTIPVTMLIGFVFAVLTTIGQRIETPFENDINDTPMSSISKTIEINLRQMLGEREGLPTPEPQVDGFLF
ncbi:bestrophin family protein [Nibrella viscosa]|uniref:Bestrophin family protein n=1 Tax=Nibrella viscosa TaxID=1084524 RepID=A0ABP8K410_9BACT